MNILKKNLPGPVNTDQVTTSHSVSEEGDLQNLDRGEGGNSISVFNSGLLASK